MTGPDDTSTGGAGGIPEQGRPAFDPWLELPRADDVPDDHPVRELLSAVADDPAAPPSAVTVAAILAAARVEHATGADTADDPLPPGIDPSTGKPRYVPPAYARAEDTADVPVKAPVPAPVWSGATTPAPVVPASVLEARRARQRRRLTAVLAAACVIGVAAVAVPFAVSRNDAPTAASAQSAATTAAAGAAASDAEQAPAAGQPLSTAGAATSTLGQSGSAAGGESIGGSENLAAPSALPAPGSAPGAVPNGTVESTPSTGAPDAGAGSGACAELPPAVATALAGALPGGLYGDPQPLTTGCGAASVYGATLPNAQGQSPLTVTINRVADGACVTADGPDLGCVSIGAGQYVSSTADGGLIIYAYAGGLEVAIAQGLGAIDGSGDPAAGSATVEELLQAAQAAADAAAASG